MSHRSLLSHLTAVQRVLSEAEEQPDLAHASSCVCEVCHYLCTGTLEIDWDILKVSHSDESSSCLFPTETADQRRSLSLCCRRKRRELHLACEGISALRFLSSRDYMSCRPVFPQSCPSQSGRGHHTQLSTHHYFRGA